MQLCVARDHCSAPATPLVPLPLPMPALAPSDKKHAAAGGKKEVLKQLFSRDYLLCFPTTHRKIRSTMPLIMHIAHRKSVVGTVDRIEQPVSVLFVSGHAEF
jgi:hypothetical protein